MAKLIEKTAKYAVVKWGFWGGGIASLHNSLNAALTKVEKTN